MDIEIIEQQDHRLGRQKVHDPRSRDFAVRRIVDRSTWHDKAVRIYDPWPNPNQRIGCCTGVAKCVQLNAVGNRQIGRVLDMDDAEVMYSHATSIDPFPGTWPPEDTGSSGLASAKAAQNWNHGGAYYWVFDGADGVIQEVMSGRAVSVGTYWYESMFETDPDGLLEVFGDIVGGHQYVIRGYDLSSDRVLGRCWWGGFRDFWLTRADLDRLLRDGGDAHYQITT